jgi:hypothetical protein
MFSGVLQRFIAWLFANEIAEERRKRLRLEVDCLAMRQRLNRLERAMKGFHIGAEENPQEGNWVVMAYKLGNRQYVNFYDFRGGNLGPFRDFLDRFRQAGAAVLVKSPFNRKPRT